MRIETKGSSIFLHDIQPKPIKIPSQLYPLTGEMMGIAQENTEPFPDDDRSATIKRIYDSIAPGVGTCYTNAQTLVDALGREGIRAETYVGWVVIGGGMPVHHCITVIGSHVLDFNIRPEIWYANAERYSGLGLDEVRKKMAVQMIEFEKVPNSEKSTFGQVDGYSLYIMSRCKPMAGLALYKKLMKAHPNHPAYRNLVDGGMSETQKLFYEKKAESKREEKPL